MYIYSTVYGVCALAYYTIRAHTHMIWHGAKSYATVGAMSNSSSSSSSRSRLQLLQAIASLRLFTCCIKIPPEGWCWQVQCHSETAGGTNDQVPLSVCLHSNQLGMSDYCRAQASINHGVNRTTTTAVLLNHNCNFSSQLLIIALLNQFYASELLKLCGLVIMDIVIMGLPLKTSWLLLMRFV